MMTKAVFLSASVPSPDRDPRYYDSADLVAIRDAVRALTAVVVPKAELVFGGHPAITPLVRLVARDMDVAVHDRVVLYQSLKFVKEFPPEVAEFERVEKIPAVDDDRDKSLAAMRHAMLTGHTFRAGVFIGGMDGVEQEFAEFGRLNPGVPRFPVASTGAAAKILFDHAPAAFPPELATDFAYVPLFQRLLGL